MGEKALSSQIKECNSGTYFYLLKGGRRLRHLNDPADTFFPFCTYHTFELPPEWVPTYEMPADAISHWGPNYTDYSLSHAVTRLVFFRFRALLGPNVELFATYLNLKCPPYVGQSKKSQWNVFLGGLDPGLAPLKTLLLMLRLT